jgi:hypothetical protein
MGSVATLDNGTNQERSLVHLGGHKGPTQLPNHTSKRTLTTSLDGRSCTRCPWLIWGDPGVSPFAGSLSLLGPPNIRAVLRTGDLRL